MARVVLENLTKIFKGAKSELIHAVKHASLVVEDKELVALVGPSGCGKTTTLRLIAGLEEVTHGTIAIDGQVVNDVPPKDRDLAMVFQNYALYPHMTVSENLAFGLKLRKYPSAEIQQRVRDAADILGLTSCLNRRPRELSGGQRQRVAVGRAIVRKPKVFLFDEPLSNLDARMRAQMRTEISRLHMRLGATMIYVTHDQVEAMTLGDRIVVMNEGVLQQAADPLALYNHPANLFVAGFIGSPPMNFFRGMLVRKGDALFFQERNRAAAVTPDGLSLRVENGATAKLADYTDREVIFGIRPENIAETLCVGGSPPGRTVEAVAEVVEPLGPETCLHLLTSAHSFVARVHPNNRVTANQKVSLVFDMSTAHFFDPATAVAIA